MAERGVGLRALARQVSYDPGYLSKVVNGRKAVSMDLARRLDEALGAAGALAAFRVTPDLRGTFTSTMRSTSSWPPAARNALTGGSSGLSQRCCLQNIAWLTRLAR